MPGSIRCIMELNSMKIDQYFQIEQSVELLSTYNKTLNLTPIISNRTVTLQ